MSPRIPRSEEVQSRTVGISRLAALAFTLACASCTSTPPPAGEIAASSYGPLDPSRLPANEIVPKPMLPTQSPDLATLLRELPSDPDAVTVPE